MTERYIESGLLKLVVPIAIWPVRVAPVQNPQVIGRGALLKQTSSSRGSRGIFCRHLFVGAARMLENFICRYCYVFVAQLLVDFQETLEFDVFWRRQHLTP